MVPTVQKKEENKTDLSNLSVDEMTNTNPEKLFSKFAQADFISLMFRFLKKVGKI